MAAAHTLETVIRPSWPIDLTATLAALWMGPGDHQMRIGPGVVERATTTAAGPASLRLESRGAEIAVTAWGPGADHVLELVPDLLGARDDPNALRPRHRLVAELARRSPGLRLTRSGRVMEALLPAVLGQKVTSTEARRSHRQLLERLGSAAPGPLGLRLPPSGATLAALPYWDYHALGVEQRRADTLRRAASVAGQLERAVERPPVEAVQMLTSIPGIGPWTAAETLRPALGDPDMVSIGDYKLPHLVCWLLAGEPRGDDARMLELLEPYRGQRARVVMLLERSGLRPPRYGPRLAPRAFRRI